MSKEGREEIGKEEEHDDICRRLKLRSPCLDSHYEAYILRSRWTVGNLYASNLYLGQEHVKYVQDIDRQLKTWLHFNERDEQKLARRVLELEALKKQYFEKSMRFIDKEFSAKEVGSSRQKILSQQMSSRQISLEANAHAPRRRLHSHVQLRGLQDVFPPKHTLGPEKAGTRPKAANVSLHPLKLLLPSQSQAVDKNRSAQRRTKSGYVYQESVSPIHKEVLSGRLASFSPRWRRRTPLSANPRLSGVSREKGGGKLVPRWVPLSFRL